MTDTETQTQILADVRFDALGLVARWDVDARKAIAHASPTLLLEMLASSSHPEDVFESRTVVRVHPVATITGPMNSPETTRLRWMLERRRDQLERKICIVLVGDPRLEVPRPFASAAKIVVVRLEGTWARPFTDDNLNSFRLPDGCEPTTVIVDVRHLQELSVLFYYRQAWRVNRPEYPTVREVVFSTRLRAHLEDARYIRNLGQRAWDTFLTGWFPNASLIETDRFLALEAQGHEGAGRLINVAAPAPT